MQCVLWGFIWTLGVQYFPCTSFTKSHPIARACVTVCPALCWVPRGLPLMVPHAGGALQPSWELPTTLCCSQSPKTFRACAQPSADYSPRGPPPAAEGAQEHVLPADPRPQLPTRAWALAAKPQQHCPLPRGQVWGLPLSTRLNGLFPGTSSPSSCPAPVRGQSAPLALEAWPVWVGRKELSGCQGLRRRARPSLLADLQQDLLSIL